MCLNVISKSGQLQQPVLILRDSIRTMSRRAQNQIRRRIEASQNTGQISRLCLDAIQIRSLTPNVRKMLEGLNTLEYLTINNCSLTNLDNFPHLPKLIVLELSDNQLQGKDLGKLSHAPETTFLTLDNNKISKIGYIEQLSCLPQLQILQVHDNPLASCLDYRGNIFASLPNLKAVDCQDQHGNRIHQQDPSEYISFRELRSHPNFDDFAGCDDEELSNGCTILQDHQGKFAKRLPFNNLGGSLYPGLSEKAPVDIMSVRTKCRDEQEEENEKPLIRDFLKKICKAQ